MKVKCQHCGYEWDTSSTMDMVTCPSCGYKTPRTDEITASAQGTSRPNTGQKATTGVRNLETKWIGALVAVVVVIAGALGAYVYMGGEEGAGGEEGGAATISVAAGSGTAFAGPEPATSGIENIVIMTNATGYSESNKLSDNSGGNVLGVIESDGGSVEIPYDQSFDIVAQVKGHDDNMAYVSLDNMEIEMEVTGDISQTAENVGKTVFDGTEGGTYIRVNGSSTNFDGLQLSADESCTINVTLYTYR